jgi:hypothetical protein
MSQKKEVYIIGGGPSLINFDFKILKDKQTIVVNKAIFHVENPTNFITMDYTFLRKVNLQRFKNIKTKKYFVANFSIPQLKIINNEIVDTRFNLRYLGVKEIFNNIVYSKTVNGIGSTFRDFRNGENSGFCALQLALLLGYTEIYLLGFDLKVDQKTHFHDGYRQDINKFSKSLHKYTYNFKIGIQEIKRKFPSTKIYSCYKDSVLSYYLHYFDLKGIK